METNQFSKRGGIFAVVFFAVICLGGAIAVHWLSGDTDPSSTSDSDTTQVPSIAALRAEIETLRSELEQEVSARRTLERRLSEFEAAWRSGGAPVASATVDEKPADLRAGKREDEDFAPGFDGQAMLAMGMDPIEVARLREQWERHEMEKLYLRDLAMREGWAGSRRFRGEQIELAIQFQEEVGDEQYDRMLYATGRPNRVLLADVFDNSPAQDAGLERGDVILRYDDGYVLAPWELRDATTEGLSGEPVPIEVLRDGKVVRLYVPRGPLGVLLKPTTVSPMAGSE